jgi:hypothetical protein
MRLIVLVYLLGAIGSEAVAQNPRAAPTTLTLDEAIARAVAASNRKQEAA